MSKPVKYFSMFSGVGGFELGIGERGECVGYSEIDKYAIMTYERHYGENGDRLPGWDGRTTQGDENTNTPQSGVETAQASTRHNGHTPSTISTVTTRKILHNGKPHTNYGDATAIDERQLPDFDLLVGGFPCQAFSVAGKRAGFNDTRGTLFFDIARVIKHKRPAHLVLENVQGLLSHDSGKTFQTILGVLADLGYGVEWQILNGKRWVPQNRVRVIIIGHLRERCGRKVLPLREIHEDNNGQHFGAAGINNPSRGYEIRRDGLASSLRATEMGSKNIIGIREIGNMYKGNPQRGRVYDKDGLSPTLSLVAGGGNKEPKIVTKTRIRRLTPLECERLMGWPDGWTEGVSDTQRYKQCGNGIIAPMVAAVMEKLELCSAAPSIRKAGLV